GRRARSAVQPQQEQQQPQAPVGQERRGASGCQHEVERARGEPTGGTGERAAQPRPGNPRCRHAMGILFDGHATVNVVLASPGMQRRTLVLGLVGIAAVILIAHSLVWNFVTDDAFISFVYSRNLAKHGQLVFNLGERVEGYTNFLWTLILTGFLKIGLP